MRFSVVIPLYNKARFIKRALDSVLIQTREDYEVIVVDDGSTDEGPDLVARFDDSRIKLVHQKNQGVSAARNKGIEEAQGKWIAFLDADDAWKPHYLDAISRLIERYPGAGIYATAYEIIMPNGKIVNPKYKAIPSAPWQGLLTNYFRSALAQPPVWTSAATVPRSIFQELGMFPVGIPIGEDLDMWGRIALKYSVAFSSDVGATYFTEDHKNTSKTKYYYIKPEAEFVRTVRAALEKSEIKSGTLDDLNEYIAKLQIAVGLECLRDGQNSLVARKILVKTSPRTLRFKLKKYRAILQTYLPDQFVRRAIRIKNILFR